jgi:hypothetical protein
VEVESDRNDERSETAGMARPQKATKAEAAAPVDPSEKAVPNFWDSVANGDISGEPAPTPVACVAGPVALESDELPTGAM